VLAAVMEESWALEYASPKLKDDREIVLAAVTQEGCAHGCALKFAGSTVKADSEVVLAAVRQDGRALEYAGAALLSNELFVFAAMRCAEGGVQCVADMISRLRHGRNRSLGVYALLATFAKLRNRGKAGLLARCLRNGFPNQAAHAIAAYALGELLPTAKELATEIEHLSEAPSPS